MRLTEVVRMDEEKILAVLRSGQKFPVYKNPTRPELSGIAMNGIVRGVLTPSGFIGFDFRNANLSDLPPMTGTPITLYFTGNDNVTVEPFHHIKVDKDQFEQMVKNNDYLKEFKTKIVWPHEAE